ncbi:MAG TPA: trypsin-like peptidase domain-containing protein [Nitrososphaeraceae archaeon]|nr:trypsin-like peptidase domain-containing protein [Nitrososphaeraceae archaeon]
MRPLILPLTVVIGLIVLPVVSLFIINGYSTIAFTTATSGLFRNNDSHSSSFVPCKKDTLAGKNVSSVPVTLADGHKNGPSVAKKSESLPNLFDRVDDSVVQVTSKQSFTNLNIIINGNPVEGQSAHLGSGFIFDNGGHVVTNNHVIGDRTKAVDVTFIDGNSYSANVIGRDPYSDLAVLRLGNDAISTEHLKPLSIGDSSCLQVGQEIVSIGNPFGLSGSMSRGIISQINRLLPEENAGFSIPGTIQIDAAINPGNSGGPLLDLNGNVVGMTTAILSDTGSFSGVGFAIPSDTIHKIIPELIAHGNYEHPFLGISGVSITPDIAKELGLNGAKGVIVASVTYGGPADHAGIQGGIKMYNDVNYGVEDGIDSNNNNNIHYNEGDIILGIDNKPVRTMDDIINHIEMSKSVGDTVTLKVLRNGNIHDISVELASRPSPSTSSSLNAQSKLDSNIPNIFP